MRFFRIAALLFFAFNCLSSSAQKKPAVISGKVVDEDDRPLIGVSISILGRERGTQSTDSGTFSIQVTSGRPLALVFSFTGYKKYQRSFNLAEGEREVITVQMEKQENV